MANHSETQYIYGSYSKNWRLRIGYTYTQNTSTKQTTCTLTLAVYNNVTAYNNVSNDAYYTLQDSTKHYQTFNYSSAKSWHTLGTKVVSVTHDSKGQGELSVSGSWYSGITSEHTPASLSISGKIIFDNIAVASKITATSAFIGADSVITLTASNSAYRHKLSFSIDGGTTFTTIAENVTTNYTWRLPTSLYNSLPNTDKNMSVIVKAETFSGSTSMGSNTATITATANETVCKPSISPVIEDRNSTTYNLTLNRAVFIKYCSNAQITVNATGMYRASIVSVKVVCGTQTLEAASGTLYGVDSATFNITVTDSRGYTTTQTVSKTLIDYTKPTISITIRSLSATGVASYTLSGNAYDGKLNVSGTKTNTRTVKVRYKEQTASSWGSWTTVTTSYDSTEKQYSYDGTLNLSYKKRYVMQACISDKVTTTAILSEEIYITFAPIYYWSAKDFYFNVPIHILENKMADFVIEAGTDDIWTYQKWYSGKAECWGRKTFTGKKFDSSAWGDLVVCASLDSVSYPYGLFVEAPVETATGRANQGALWLYPESAGDGMNTRYQTAKYSVARPTANTQTQEISIDFYVVGRWKSIFEECSVEDEEIFIGGDGDGDDSGGFSTDDAENTEINIGGGG